MNGNPEADEFDEDDEAALDADDSDADFDRVARELERAQRRDSQPASGVPAWRRLELLMEDKRMAELISDFDDYDIGKPASRRRPRR